MSGKGGDTKLDVISILRRARDPDGLGQLRRAIEELGERDGSQQLEQLMTAMQETREQVHAVAVAVEALAVREPGADHLTDVTKMVSYTLEVTLESRVETHWAVDTPSCATYFAARAVSMNVIDPYDRCIYRSAVVQEAHIAGAPMLVGIVPSGRWAAPPGRGHPAGWMFSCFAHASRLEFKLSNPHDIPVLVQLTLSGDTMNELPPGWRCGHFDSGGAIPPHRYPSRGYGRGPYSGGGYR